MLMDVFLPQKMTDVWLVLAFVSFSFSRRAELAEFLKGAQV
jgi:hypothetical protein